MGILKASSTGSGCSTALSPCPRTAPDSGTAQATGRHGSPRPCRKRRAAEHSYMLQ